MLTGIMRASGTVFAPTCLSIPAIFAIELPLAYLLNAKVGLSGIWFAYAATFVSILLFQMIFFQLVWRRRNVAALI